MTINEAWNFLKNNNLFGGSDINKKKCVEAYKIATEDLLLLRFGLKEPSYPATVAEVNTMEKATPWRIVELYHKCQLLQQVLTYGLDII